MEFLKDYVKLNNLIIKPSKIGSQYFCNICENILHSPKASRCGTSYCSSCIFGHTDCPGCGKSLNELENHIADDFRKEVKIGNLILECPNTFCTMHCKVNEIKNHLLACTNKGVPCLFNDLGCNSSVESKKMLHKHITSDLTGHLDLLLMNVADGRNETKQKLDSVETRVNAVELDLNQNANNINTIDNFTKSVDRKLDGLASSLSESSEGLDRRIKVIEDDMSMDVKTDIANMKIQMREFREFQKRMEKMQSAKFIQVKNHYKVTFMEMSRKSRTYVNFSELFVIESYNFKIAMYFLDRSLIDLELYLVKGPNDDSIEWPLKRQIKMSLLRFDGSIYLNHEFSYLNSPEIWKPDYSRPSGSIGNRINDSHIMEYTERIMQNNTISIIVSMLD